MSEENQQVRLCSALNCTAAENAASEVTFHRFPPDPERCKEWVKFAGNPCLPDRSLEDLSESAYLCHYHFGIDQYESFAPRTLVPDALPTVFPSLVPHPSSSASSVEISASSLHSPFVAHPSTSATCPPSIGDPKEGNPPLPILPQKPSLFFPPPSSSPWSVLAPYAYRRRNTLHLSELRAKCLLLKEFGFHDHNISPWSKLSCFRYRQLRRRYSCFRKEISFIEFYKNANTLALLILKKYLRNVRSKWKGMDRAINDILYPFLIRELNPFLYFHMKQRIKPPSQQTLFSILSCTPLGAGINPGVLKHLSYRISLMSKLDRHCVLLFDTMSIKPSFAFDSRSDCMEGSDDRERGQSDAIVQEALVFMVQGLRHKWNQPVAFFFDQKSVSGEILAGHIREVVDALQHAGLKVAATVCDTGSSNVTALKMLGYSVERPYFVFNGQKIFTLHDPLHLIKCTWNMFMKYPVKGEAYLCNNVVRGIASWSQLKEIYDTSMAAINKLGMPSLQPLLPELTEAHLNPTPRQRKNLTLAAEVFSKYVAGLLFPWGVREEAPKESYVASLFHRFMYTLFQSLNGKKPEQYFEISTSLDSCIGKGSPHLKLWTNAPAKIRKWVFIKDGRCVWPRSQKGWVITTQAAKMLWLRLRKAGFPFLEPQRLSLNPLEKFFSSIRQCCGANCRPTVEQFASAYKTLIVKDISLSLSRGLRSYFSDSTVIEVLYEFLQMYPDILEETDGSRRG